jgi:hypothetical protein
MNQKFYFLAETNENLDLEIKIRAEINPLKALKCLENIQKEVKRMQKDILNKLETQIENK